MGRAKKQELLELMKVRLRELYNTEITFREFKEILAVYFLRKEKESPKGKKGKKLQDMFKAKLKKFLEPNPTPKFKKHMKENRIWERTEKDFLKDRLEERLEEEKQRRLERKRKEAE